jgi:hypothetical protein
MLQEQQLSLKEYLTKYAAINELAIIEVDVDEVDEPVEEDPEDIEIWKLQNEIDDTTGAKQIDDTNGAKQIDDTDSSINNTEIKSDFTAITTKTTSKPLLLSNAPKKSSKTSTKRSKKSDTSDDSLEVEKPTAKKTRRNVKEKILECPQTQVMLSDEHIIAAINMLKFQFSDIGGLVDCLRFQSDRPFDYKVNDRSVYILHSNASHWVITSFLSI